MADQSAKDDKELDYKSDIYSVYRRNTPETVISKILIHLKKHYKGPLDIAVDVGCGSGQGTVALAPFFKKVYGIDNLENQIKEAESSRKLDNIEYSVGPSEKLPFRNETVQLITAATSIHWFDLDSFFPEVIRVLCDNGIFAAYVCVDLRPIFNCLSTMGRVAKIYDDLVEDLEDYSLPQARIAYQKYKTINFPFQEVKREYDVRCPLQGTLTDCVGLAKTHSGIKRCQEQDPAKAEEIINKFQKRLFDIGKEENISPNDELTLYRDFSIVTCRKIMLVS